MARLRRPPRSFCKKLSAKNSGGGKKWTECAQFVGRYQKCPALTQETYPMNSLLIFWICARNTASVLIGDDMDMKLQRYPFYNGRAKVFTAFGAKASCRQRGSDCQAEQAASTCRT